MSEEHVTSVLNRAEGYTGDVLRFTRDGVFFIDDAVHSHLVNYRQETVFRISLSEIKLTRITISVTYDAEFHLLKAYYHASPGLIDIIIGIFDFIKWVIGIVNTINTIVEVITGETLGYWIDKLIPGFQEAWNKMMNNISKFSGALGWGVDGVMHLMNVVNIGSSISGALAGKSTAGVKIDKYGRLMTSMGNFRTNLEKWQSEPGKMISELADYNELMSYNESSFFFGNLTANVGIAAKKIETVAKDVGDITHEVLSIRNDMPAFIAKNIPQVIWDALGWADTMINDRLLPRIDQLQEKLNTIDNLLDQYRSDAASIAKRLSKPGDLLAEINNLPDYVRKDQLVKIDGITSSLISEQNAVDYAAVEPDLKEFSMVAEALSHVPAPLGFMELELPGRSPGITPEPRESWFVGDY